MKKNILVVDDSALMRRAICDIINSGNEYEATDTCRDGLEAYDKIKKNSYDAVLLDINMPRMNGLELLQKLQKENIRATVVVVSSLAKEDAKITIQAMEYGAVDFITKPENIVEAKGMQFREDLTRLFEFCIASNANEASDRLSCKTGGSGFCWKIICIGIRRGGCCIFRSSNCFCCKGIFIYSSPYSSRRSQNAGHRWPDSGKACICCKYGKQCCRSCRCTGYGDSREPDGTSENGSGRRAEANSTCLFHGRSEIFTECNSIFR